MDIRDAPLPELEPATQATQRDLALEVAQLYRVFEQEPRAKRLLEIWERATILRDTPAEASLQRYAADEALRQFVRGIRRQIELSAQLERT